MNKQEREENRMKKMKAFWKSLEGTAVISKRELFLGLTTCALAGLVLGVFFSPKKKVAIGSNNGSHNTGNGCDNVAEGSQKDEKGRDIKPVKGKK